ncbi:MAG: thymidylate kinase [Candidatus Saccharimonadales bacterium]
MTGTFIVLEGSDGSGKTTQFRLLQARLRALGYDVEVFDFPRYDQDSSHFIRKYLNGDYGRPADVSPYSASLFYALDRFEAAADIRKTLSAGKIVLSDRYVGSNMAHQGSKIDAAAQLRGYFVWNDNLEYRLLGIPRPTISIYLRVPADISYDLMAKRAVRSYTDKVRDGHEADLNHLQKTVKTYDLLCQLFPKDYIAIDCTDNQKILGIAEINDRIWEVVKPLLPASRPHRPKSLTVNINEPVMPAIHAKKTAKRDGLTTKGDKVLIFESRNVSLLALASVIANPVKLEMTPSKDYFTPSSLPANLQKFYKESLEHLSKLQNQLRAGLHKHDNTPNEQILAAVASIRPLASLYNIRILATHQAAGDLIDELALSSLKEARWLGDQLAAAAKNMWPATQALRGHTPPEAVRKIIAEISKNHLPQKIDGASEPVRLLQALPRNEFEILADGIYPFSNLSKSDIENELDSWSYEQKSQALSAIVAKPTLSREICYRLDAICDFLSFQTMRSSSIGYDFSLQPPTPRYGYDMPKIIEDAGLEDTFMECFDESLKLYSTLQSKSSQENASYATLTGHKIRMQFNLKAADLSQALHSGSPKPDTYLKLLEEIQEKVSSAHPIIWASLSKGKENAPILDKPKTRRTRSKKRVRPS